MKKEFKLLCMTLSAAAFLTSCLSEEHEFGKPSIKEEGKGTLVLNLNANAEFSNETRALTESDYTKKENYNVKVIQADNNNVLLDCYGSELSSKLPLTLEGGSYRVEASYGKEKDASRDEFLVKGSKTITIKAKDEKDVTVDCTPTCGKISANFDPKMSIYYKEYSISFGGTEALGTKTINWEKDDVDPWYVALKDGGETIAYTIKLKVNENYLHENEAGNTSADCTVTGTFKLERNKAKKLVVTPNYTPTTDGGMTLKITIDESTNDKPIDYEVPVTWI